MSYVYFIGPRWADPFVKIGFTKHCPFRRLKALQTGSPFAIEVLAYMRGTEKVERMFHDVFAPLRMNGEWFHRHGKLSDFVHYLFDSGYERRPANAEELHAAVNDCILSNTSSGPEMTNADYCATANPSHILGWYEKFLRAHYPDEVLAA